MIRREEQAEETLWGAAVSPVPALPHRPPDPGLSREDRVGSGSRQVSNIGKTRARSDRWDLLGRCVVSIYPESQILKSWSQAKVRVPHTCERVTLKLQVFLNSFYPPLPSPAPQPRRPSGRHALLCGCGAGSPPGTRHHPALSQLPGLPRCAAGAA